MANTVLPSEQTLTFEYVEAVAERSIPKDGHNVHAGFTSPDGRIAFTRYFDSPYPKLEDNTLIRFGDDQATAKEYSDALQTPGFIASGTLQLNGYTFFESCALPIDFATGNALIGEPICWGGDFAHWYAKDHKLPDIIARMEEPSFRRQVAQILRGKSDIEQGIVLSQPGHEIYGHWLLDIVPKLNVLSRADPGKIPIFCNSVPAWASYFLDCFEFDKSRLRKHPAQSFRLGQALIPTSSKSGYRLGAASLRDAWARISQIPSVPLPEGLAGAKVFFSRRKWKQSTRSSVFNIVELETLAEARGYKIIAPEELTIPQQITLVRDARILVGEDGSALHSIIFAETGARLGVISLPDRANLWHYGICHILGHRLAYCYAQPEDTPTVPAKTFNSFLDVLEQG